jgi:hypothetical protein
MLPMTRYGFCSGFAPQNPLGVSRMKPMENPHMRIAWRAGRCVVMALAVLPLHAHAQAGRGDANVLKISSGIVKTWGKPFVLRPDDLRRIAGELERAARDLPIATQIVVAVIRQDERF